MRTIFNITNCCNNMFHAFEWPYKNLRHVAATNCCVKNCPRAMFRKKSPRVTSLTLTVTGLLFVKVAVAQAQGYEVFYFHTIAPAKTKPQMTSTRTKITPFLSPSLALTFLPELIKLKVW